MCVQVLMTSETFHFVSRAVDQNVHSRGWSKYLFPGQRKNALGSPSFTNEFASEFTANYFACCSLNSELFS